MSRMGDNIEYTLILKSYPYSGTFFGDANNDISYNVHTLFQKISSLHHCNLAKMELVGGLFAGQSAADLATAGIDIMIEMPYAKNTMYQTVDACGQLIAGSFRVDNYAQVNGYNTMSSSNPIYLENLGNITYLNIKLYETIGCTILNMLTDITNPLVPVYSEYPPAYMLTFKVIPIMNS